MAKALNGTNYCFRIDLATLQNELPDVDFSQINGDSIDFSDSAQVEQLAQALEGVDFEQLMTNFARLFHLCAPPLIVYLVSNLTISILKSFSPTRI